MNSIKKISRNIILLAGMALVTAGTLSAQSPGKLLGADMSVKPNKYPGYLLKLDLFKSWGIQWVRVGMPPAFWWDSGTGKPTPEKADWAVEQCLSRGLTPYIMLDWQPEFHGGDIDDFNWGQAASEFAQHFKGKVFHYSVMNEPDHNESSIATSQYAQKIAEVADAIHLVDTSIVIFPAGLANFMNEKKAKAFTEAVAPLLNSGKIAALNLHMYNNPNKDITTTNYWAPNQFFSKRKTEGGITANVQYCTSEWNYRTGSLSESEQAARFLTVFWDNVGVVGNEGNNDQKTLFAGVYQIWGADPGKNYVLALNRPEWGQPFRPKPRAKTLRRTLEFTNETEFTDISPQDHGRYILEDTLQSSKKIWVVQNRPGWRSEGATETLTVDGIPSYANHIEIWYWDGRDTILQKTGSSMTLNVRSHETIMIAAVDTVKNDQPEIEIISPANGKQYAGISRLSFILNTYDWDGVEKVEFYLGTEKIGETAEPEHNFTWENPVKGNHDIITMAYDAMGNTSSDTVSINILSVVSVLNPEAEPAFYVSGPNPFRKLTEFQLNLVRSADISIRIFDMSGRQVKQIFKGKLAAGTYPFYWDGSDEKDNPLPAGVYLLNMTEGRKATSTRRILKY